MVVVNFSDCVTYMLFPYVNTYNASGSVPMAIAHWGTNISIANTTTDPFGPNPVTANGSAVPQSGSCTVYFYPASGSGMVSYTTPTIPSGGLFGFGVGTALVPFYNNTGYAIAICNFQNAYGWAYLYDNYGISNPTYGFGYAAYILPNPALYHRTPAGGGLGENAIDPGNINRQALNLLMRGGPSKK
jgi:hypothetical protein